MIQEIDIKKVKENPENPRNISKEKFKLLLKSIQDFPDMLQKRPLICVSANGDYQVLGGNQRLKALQELNFKTVPVMLADDWTEKQRKRFLISDNCSFGEWNFEMLEADWQRVELESWGIDIDNKKKTEVVEEEVKPVNFAHYLISISINEVDKILNDIEKLKEKGANILSNVN